MNESGERRLEVEIHEATPADVDTIFRFLKPFADAEQLVPRTLDEIETLAAHGFMARIGNRMVGFAAVEIYSRKLAEVQCLAVSPNMHGQGIGRRLVRHCVERAQREGVLELMVISNSEDFLRRCGFEYSLPQQKRAFFIQPQQKND